jgi:hypothetical protein
MMICVTPEEAARTSKVTSEVEGGSMLHVLGEKQVPDGPLAFIASQEQICVLPTHFHAADQFQLIIAGTGKIGGHKVSVGTIHYSDAYTPYGPVVPGNDGLSYLTLRPRYNYAYHVLPECKELLQQKMRVHRGAQKIVETDLDQSLPAGNLLLWSRSDGVAVSRIDAGPDEQLSVEPSASGRFCVVMRGAVHFQGRRCPEKTCIWLGPGETLPAVAADSEGAVVVVLSFAPQH